MGDPAAMKYDVYGAAADGPEARHHTVDSVFATRI